MNIELEEAYNQIIQLENSIEEIIQGKSFFIKQFLAAFLAKGHILLEDVPGLGKTTMAKTLAKLIANCDTKRIQCTPDLLPYDITGVDVYEAQTGQFRFEFGPIFCDILLADELNRATPKTQSALLEAMAENQVTIGTKNHILSPFFFVIATQNPIDDEGCYPLPIAELDRFLVKLSIGYPDEKTEFSIVKKNPVSNLNNLKPIFEKETLLNIQKLINQIHCEENLIQFVVKVAQKTRNHQDIVMGVSPRGPIGAIKIAKSYAFLNNRDYVILEDLIELLPMVYLHRLLINPSAYKKQQLASVLLDDFIKQTIKEYF